MIFKKGGKYHIAWRGPDNPIMGYGSSNLNMLKALRSSKVVSHPSAVDDGGPGITAEDCTVGVVYAPAGLGALERLPSPYRIVFTMFEADTWPTEWVSACNCANQVWVPSEFCKEAAIASGVESPIEIVPLGVDSEVYYPEPFEAKEASPTFTFGFSGAATMRKGFDILTQAFQQEFGHNEPVRLEIRSAHHLSATMPNDSRVVVIPGGCADFKMREWYRHIDCFVMPTRGEGFGLTPLEAMACGTPAIVTNWGGCVDYLGDYALRVGLDGLESCADYHKCGGKWASPSVASVRYCMRYAYEHRDEIRQMGDKAAGTVLEKWTYGHTAKVIEKLLAGVDPKERVEIESRSVVVWYGYPRTVFVKGVGQFVREIARELSDEKAALLVNDDRFVRERRYRRAKGSA